MKIKSRLLKGLGANALAQCVIAIVQLISVPIYLSHWSASLYGAWLLLFTLPGYLALSDFGFATAAGNDMTLSAAAENFDAVNRTFSSLWFGVITISIVSGALVVAAIYTLPARVFPGNGIIAVGNIRITAVILTGYAFFALNLSSVLAAYRCTRMYPQSVYAASAVFFTEGSLTALVVMFGGNIVACATAYAIVRLCAIPIIYAYLRKKAPWLRFSYHAVNLVELRRLAPSAIATMGLPLGNALNMQGMVFAVAQSGHASDIAVFSVVRTIARLGFQLAAMVSNSIMPEFTLTVGEGSHQKATRLFAANLVATIPILTTVVFTLVLAGPAIIRMWTHGSIQPPYALVVGMAISVFFLGLWQLMANLLLAVNRHASYSYLYPPIAICAVLTAIFAVRIFGLKGVIAPVVLSDLSMLIVILYKFDKLMKVNWIEVRNAIKDVIAAILGQARSYLP
jgi:O-antigen/teichoic acid export membrane protein